MTPGVDCDCMYGQTDYCDTCRLPVAECDCWLDDELPDEDAEDCPEP